MLEFIMSIFVALFYMSVLTIVFSLLVEVAAPGEFKTLHKIYRTIFEFEEEEEL